MISGFVTIDKPAGITSHDVVSRVRRIIGTKRVGHTGTLDPFATGVLPIAVNDGTKAIPYLDEGVKRYEAVMQLGVATDTLDMTGQILCEKECSSVGRNNLQDVLNRFTGIISQIPPMYSAIKQNGQPLYKLARQGQDVIRAARQVEIHSIELLSFSPPFASISVSCSRGTYIRTLADDIGSTLGCGAALKELRRTVSGPFRVEKAVTLAELEAAVAEGRSEALCLSLMVVLDHLQEIPLTFDGLEGLRFGRAPTWGATCLETPVMCPAETVVRLTYAGNLVAMAKLVPGRAADAAIVLKRVLI